MNAENVVADTNIDKDKQIAQLRAELKKMKSSQKYGLVWEDHPEELDNKNVIPLLHHNKELSLPKIDGKPDNYLIEGDNYHALKTLQHTHKGLVDVIYIDPPYNTGNQDFVYNDKMVDIEDGFRHSKWLSFMEKRLKLARNLMTDEGVIFVSIDDNEQANLKLLMDKVFGEQNFVANFIYKTANQTSDNNKKQNHEYILCYTLQLMSSGTRQVLRGRPITQEARCTTGNVNQTQPVLRFPKGLRVEGVVDGNYKSPRQLGGMEDITLVKGNITVIEGLLGEDIYLKARWSNSNDIRNMVEMFESDNNYDVYNKFKKQLTDLYLKGDRFQPIMSKLGNESLTSILNDNTSRGSRFLDDMCMKGLFSYPKDVGLLKNLIGYVIPKNAIVLDFFAGSGTTGHAVMELNKEDGGNRSFILCTNNEVSDENERNYLYQQGVISKNNKTEYNKYIRDYSEGHDTFVNSDEYQTLGIARAVTRERIKRVIEGYTTPKGKVIEGLPNNLTYLQTHEFDKIDARLFSRNKLVKLALNSHYIKYPECDYETVIVDIMFDVDAYEIQHKDKDLVFFLDFRDTKSMNLVIAELFECFGKDINFEMFENYYDK